MTHSYKEQRALTLSSTMTWSWAKITQMSTLQNTSLAALYLSLMRIATLPKSIIGGLEMTRRFTICQLAFLPLGSQSLIPNNLTSNKLCCSGSQCSQTIRLAPLPEFSIRSSSRMFFSCNKWTDQVSVLVRILPMGLNIRAHSLYRSSQMQSRKLDQTLTKTKRMLLLSHRSDQAITTLSLKTTDRCKLINFCKSKIIKIILTATLKTTHNSKITKKARLRFSIETAATTFSIHSSSVSCSQILQLCQTCKLKKTQKP